MECCESTEHGGETDSRGDPSATEPTTTDWSLFRLALAAFLAGNSMIVSLSINLSDLASNVRLFIEIALLGATIIVVELVGRPLLHKVWRGVRRREITFEFLFVTGIIGALGASIVSMVRGHGPVYFEISAILVVIYAAGNRVGQVSRRRGIAAARRLETDVESVRRRRADGAIQSVPLDAIDAGDQVVVEADEEIPVDGIVRCGEAFVHDDHITGEWASRIKRPGDDVYAGSTVYQSGLTIEVTAPVGDRLIDSIQAAVEQAWEQPSEWQARANRIVQWFFPLVAAVAGLTVGYWAWMGSWETALFNGLSVLLIACPCALGFAVPLAVWMTLGHYAERGFVAEASDVVEKLARCDVAVFDKTGTLTTGGAEFVDIVADPRQWQGGRRELLAYVGTLEQGSDHPVSTAFEDLPDESDHLTLLESQTITGTGIEGRLRDETTGTVHHVSIGTAAMVADDEHHRWSALVDRLNASDAQRRLAICVDGHLAGAAAVSEEHVARIDSMKSAFQQLGVSTILMTGDERERAEQIGFERTYAECTPTQKQSIVEQLQAEADGVCYIGDGINDAVAMTAADVGIACGDGSTLTIDSADIVWHGSDLRDIPSLFRSAREAVRVIRSNLGYAIAYNLAGMGAAAVGWLHPVLAAVLMVASSLFVTWRTALTLDESA